MREDSIAATPRAGEVTRDGVVGVNEARRIAAGALRALVPPDEITPEHTALVLGLDDLVAGTDRLLAATEGSSAEAFATTVETAADLQSLAERVALACNGLEARLIDLGTPATIRC